MDFSVFIRGIKNLNYSKELKLCILGYVESKVIEIISNLNGDSLVSYLSFNCLTSITLKELLIASNCDENLGADDLELLCDLIHQSIEELGYQKTANNLQHYVFIPPVNIEIYMNSVDNILQSLERAMCDVSRESDSPKIKEVTDSDTSKMAEANQKQKKEAKDNLAFVRKAKEMQDDRDKFQQQLEEIRKERAKHCAANKKSTGSSGRSTVAESRSSNSGGNGISNWFSSLFNRGGSSNSSQPRRENVRTLNDLPKQFRGG